MTTKSSSVPSSCLISFFKARPDVEGATSSLFLPTLDRMAKVTFWFGLEAGSGMVDEVGTGSSGQKSLSNKKSRLLEEVRFKPTTKFRQTEEVVKKDLSTNETGSSKLGKDN